MTTEIQQIGTALFGFIVGIILGRILVWLSRRLEKTPKTNKENSEGKT